MITVYLCFLAGGAVLPIISFFLGFLGGGEADVDTDLNLDTDINVDADINVDTEINVDTDIEATAGLDSEIGTGSASPDFSIDPGTDAVLSIGFFPTSLLSLSMLAITFGAVGGVMTYTGRGKLLTFVVALLAGYAASVVVQTIIKTLKKVQSRSYGVDENELLLYDGKVVDTILPGQLGSVSFETLKGVLVTYPARCADENLRLGTGKVVKAKEIQNGVFIVEPKNKYE